MINYVVPPPPPASSGLEGLVAWAEEMREIHMRMWGALYTLGTGLELDADNKVSVDQASLAPLLAALTNVHDLLDTPDAAPGGDQILVYQTSSGAYVHPDTITYNHSTGVLSFKSLNVGSSGGTVTLNDKRAQNVADPTSAQDAATKNYVDVTHVGAQGHVPLTGNSAADLLHWTGSAWDNIALSSVDHGGLGGKSDDDHPQYILAAGTRAFSGAQSFGSNKATNVATGTAAADASVVGQTPNSAWSREFWVVGTRIQDTGGGTVTNSGPSIANNTDYDAVYASHHWLGSNKEAFYFSFAVPDDLDRTAAVTAHAYYSPTSTPGSSDVVELEITCRAIADVEDLDSGGTKFDIAQTEEVGSSGKGSTATDLVITSMGTLFGADTLGAGDFIHGMVFRDATAGNSDDTFSGAIRFLGLVLKGTKKMIA